MWLVHSLCLRSSFPGRYAGCVTFWLLGVVLPSTFMSTVCLYMGPQLFGGFVPSRIAGFYGHPVLNFLSNPILVASILHNPPAGLRGLVFPHPHQHRSLSAFFFFCNHPRGCEAVSGCGFDLHFLNNQWCGLPGSSPGGTREFEAGTESARKNLFI